MHYGVHKQAGCGVDKGYFQTKHGKNLKKAKKYFIFFVFAIVFYYFMCYNKYELGFSPDICRYYGLNLRIIAEGRRGRLFF